MLSAVKVWHQQFMYSAHFDHLRFDRNLSVLTIRLPLFMRFFSVLCVPFVAVSGEAKRTTLDCSKLSVVDERRACSFVMRLYFGHCPFCALHVR